MTQTLTSLPDGIVRQRVLNTSEAAAFLNFSVSHLRRLYRRGGIPAPIQLGARKLGWRLGDLIDWVAARQSRPVTA
ncbi:helix-turn-helix domain-containing protein [Microvirga ossetica]|uniref:helix-turn-helix transcriptional regulator n=1 Tax=Microvirga ossetica TaxID=1882682 RepID=UPI00130004A9